MVQPKG